MHFRIWGPPIAASLIASCAIGPTLQERSASIPPPDPDKARVFIYRLEEPWQKSQLQARILIAGSFVGEAVARGVRYVDLSPGNNCIAVDQSASRADQFSPPICIGMRAGEVHYVRVAYRSIEVLRHSYEDESYRNGRWVRAYKTDSGRCWPGRTDCEEYADEGLRIELGAVDAETGRAETCALVLLDPPKPGA